MICLKDECINTLNDKNIFKSKQENIGPKDTICMGKFGC